MYLPKKPPQCQRPLPSHMMVAEAMHRFMPRDVPAWYMWGDCLLFLLVTYAVIRGLERANIYIRL